MLQTSRCTALLLACGIVAGPLLLLAVVLDGSTRPGYDPWRHGVSQLVLGDRGWLARSAFVLCGLLLLAFASGVHRLVPTRAGADWRLRMLVAVAVGSVIAGAVPTDPALGYPPGATEEAGISLAGAIHQVGGTLLFVGLIGGAVVGARRFARSGRQGWAVYSIVTGVLVAATALSAGIVYRLVDRGVISTGPAGFLELTSMVLGFAWTALLARHLLESSRGRAEPAADDGTR